MEFHEIVDIFPEMTESEYQELKDDIEKFGLREPVVTHNGKLIDGRHRYRACKELGLEVETVEWDRKGSLVEFVLSRNLHRRHLTTAQRAMLAADIRVLFEKQAKKRQGTRTDLGAILRQGETGKSSEHAAKLVSVSSRSVESASKIRQKGVPALTAAVKKGKLSIASAAMIAGLPENKQEAVVSIGDRRLLKKAVRAIRFELSGETEKEELRRTVLYLVRRANVVVGNRDPESVAGSFFLEFPFEDKRMVQAFEDNLQGVRLFSELYELWKARVRDPVSNNKFSKAG